MINIFNQLFRNVLRHKIDRIKRDLCRDDFEPNNYQVFNSLESANDWGHLNYSNWTSQLKDDHDKTYRTHLLVRSSFLAIELYSGYNFKEVNRFLRFGEITKFTGKWREIISYLDFEFNRNILSDNIISVRWLNITRFRDLLNSKKEGDEIIDPAYLSTSLHFNHNANNDGHPRKLGSDGLFIIKIAKGNKCLYLRKISNRDAEQEILLPRNTVLKVEKIYSLFFKKIVVVCSVKLN